MPIRINYDVPVATAGPIAYAAGRGLFEQERDKYNEGVRQFDAKMGQNESQFSRDLNYKQELALLEDRRNQERLAQQAYQFEAQQSGSAYQREMDRRNRLQQMGLGEMFQVGREDRADVRDIAGEERQEERQLSREARMRQDREAEKQYLASNKDAEIILKQGLNQEQLAQAASQWEERNGRPFPYQGGLQQRMSESEGVAIARGILKGTGAWNEGLEAAFEIMPPEEAAERAFAIKEKADERKNRLDLTIENNRSKEVLERGKAEAAADTKELEKREAAEQERVSNIREMKKERRRDREKRRAELRKVMKDVVDPKDNNLITGEERKWNEQQIQEMIDVEFPYNMTSEQVHRVADGERVYVGGRGGTKRIIDGKHYVDWD